MKNKCLIISPHLDDAILSCGAAMAQWQHEGADVIVASVFSSCADHSPELISIYENRRKQDIEAIEFLGAKAIHLGFTDAPFRDTSYHNFSTILFHHQAEDIQMEQSIAAAISKLILKYKPEIVLFPMGVGGHIDHHLVHRSSFQLVLGGEKLHFYEELPYALVPGWTEVRLHQLGYEHSIKFSQKFPGNLLDVQLPFVHNYTMDEADKKASDTQYRNELNSLNNKKNNDKGFLIQEKRYFNHEIFEKKYEAILHYQTEWPALFGKTDNIQKLLNPEGQEIYTESFWKIK